MACTVAVVAAVARTMPDAIDVVLATEADESLPAVVVVYSVVFFVVEAITLMPRHLPDRCTQP